MSQISHHSKVQERNPGCKKCKWKQIFSDPCYPKCKHKETVKHYYSSFKGMYTQKQDCDDINRGGKCEHFESKRNIIIRLILFIKNLLVGLHNLTYKLLKETNSGEEKDNEHGKRRPEQMD